MGLSLIELTVLYEEEMRTQTHTDGRPCEDTERRRPSTSRGERRWEEPALPPPASWTSSLWDGGLFEQPRPLWQPGDTDTGGAMAPLPTLPLSAMLSQGRVPLEARQGCRPRPSRGVPGGRGGPPSTHLWPHPVLAPPAPGRPDPAEESM